MRRILPKLVAGLLAVWFLLTPTYAQVGDIKAKLPAAGTLVTVRATVPVPLQNFNRFVCPYRLRDSFGNDLPTQWEMVARLRDRLVVELLAPYAVIQGGWNDFQVVSGSNTFDLTRFQQSTIAALSIPDSVRLVLEDYSGNFHTTSISGPGGWQFDRLGLAKITAHKAFTGEHGGWHVWATLDANRQEFGLVLNFHNGALPARPDLHFRSVRLELPAGWAWTNQLPDPISDNGYLITPGQHVLPQRMERLFRLRVHPINSSPQVAEEGWGVGDWRQGGYLAQDHALPDLGHVNISLLPDAADAYQRLASFQPTVPGEQPVDKLWPAKGVLYGGMTGGIDIYQIPGVELASTGQPPGLLYFLVDQLRYGARHRSAIYEPNGELIELDDYLNPDGSAPWVMFNATFLGNPPQDAPFGFSQVPPAIGSSNYDPTIFDPIDTQHLVRRLNANRVLAWLSNDPVAKFYLRGDAELSRMTFYEGPGGRLAYPSRGPGLGGDWGRGEAWAADVLANCFALEDDAYRARMLPWFERYIDVLEYAQMPNGMFSAVQTGKIAENPPYGDGSTAFYFAHRSNEQIELGHGLRGIQESVGLPTDYLIRKLGDGIWRFAWKLGNNGVLDRYPCAPVGTNRRWYTRDQFPPGLTTIVPNDGYHVGTILAYAIEAGSVDALDAVLAHTGQPNLHQAKLQLLNWGTENLANRAPLVRIAQLFFP